MKSFNQELNYFNDKNYKYIDDYSKEYFYYTYDYAGNYTFFSPSVKNILGYNIEDLETGFTKYFTNNSLNNVINDKRELTLHGVLQPIYIAEIYHNNGKKILLEILEFPIFHNNKVISINGIARDITKKKREEEALIENEKNLSLIFNSTHEFIALLKVEEDNEYIFEAINKFYSDNLKLYDIQIKNIKGMDLRYYLTDILKLDESHIKTIYSLHEQSILEKKTLILESVNKVFNAKEIWSELHITPVFNKHGKCTHIISIIRDIDEKKKMEIELEKSRIFTDNLIESASIMIIGLSNNNKIKLFNSSAEMISGFNKQDVMGKNFFELFYYKNELQVEKEKLKNLISSSIESTFQTFITIKTGEDRLISWNSSKLIQDEKESGILLFGTDITEKKKSEEERKKLEEYLIQSQKMDALGTLAGGIAHDFNNILGAVLGYSEIALNETKGNNILIEYIKGIKEASLRAADLVKQILTFSKQSEIDKHPVDVESVIREVVKLLKSSIPSTIKIQYSVEDRLNPVMADFTQLHQVIMNLCTNAYHAMLKRGGNLTISLKELNLYSEEKFHGFAILPGKYALLIISDTGSGMSKRVQERIFDPYFTTKEKGKGTGLGLSVVRSIIKNYNGYISVYSEKGIGTTFKVYLPCIENEEAEEVQRETEDIPKGTERIIFVDDEKLYADMMGTMLNSLGYKVKIFLNSAEAFEYIKENIDSFDCLITDMTMPSMTGIELISKLKQLDKSKPTILCTGFSELITETKAKKCGVNAYLMKPIIKTEIAAVIRNVLDKLKN